MPFKVCENCRAFEAKHTCPNCMSDVCDNCWGVEGECRDCEAAIEYGGIFDGLSESMSWRDYDDPDDDPDDDDDVEYDDDEL